MTASFSTARQTGHTQSSSASPTAKVTSGSLSPASRCSVGLCRGGSGDKAPIPRIVRAADTQVEGRWEERHATTLSSSTTIMCSILPSRWSPRFPSWMHPCCVRNRATMITRMMMLRVEAPAAAARWSRFWNTTAASRFAGRLYPRLHTCATDECHECPGGIVRLATYILSCQDCNSDGSKARSAHKRVPRRNVCVFHEHKCVDGIVGKHDLKKEGSNYGSHR